MSPSAAPAPAVAAVAGLAAVPAPARGWRRLLPQSLFGRLMGVLALGLMLAQLLSAWINVAERDQLLARGYGVNTAQRIADVVALLDSLPEAERARVVAVFRVPPLLLSLAEAPSLPEQAVLSGRGALFAQRLRSALGEPPRVLRVAPGGPQPGATDPDAWPWGGHGREHQDDRHLRRLDRQVGQAGDGSDAAQRPGATDRRGAMRDAARAGRPILRTEVQLRDGRWARFDAALPAAPERLPWRLALTLAVLLLSMLLLSWLAVRWVVRPLGVLAQAAEGLGQDMAQAPLPEDGPREVRQAAMAFNTMQQRLLQFIRERTRLLAALSHDLKTPLTRMRLRTALLDDGEARARFDADLLEMETMVGQTLDFMRGLGGHEQRVPVDLNALLASLQADQQAMGRDVMVSGRASAAFTGVPMLLRRALGNLVDNAVLYGGRATLQVQDAAEQLVIEVLDPGPGIPEAELDRVFEPFHRLEASRSRATGGTGLGLGIARSIAQLHGGSLTLHNRPDGGLCARLSLPRRRADTGTWP